MKKLMPMLISSLLISSTVLPMAQAETAEPVAETTISSNSTASTGSNTSGDTAAGNALPAKTAEPKPVKTADDYKDLKVLSKDLKEKFNFFIAEGALQAESDDTFGVNNVITREHFLDAAKAAFEHSEDKTLTKTSFMDELKKIGFVDTDGQLLNPSSTIKRQELARLLIYCLGFSNDARKVTPTVDTSVQNLDRVDSTQRRFVTYALQLKLMSNQDDGRFHGSDRDVTLRTLVDAVFETKRLYGELNDQEKISISEAKAVGAKKITVTFNKLINNEDQAVLALKKDGTSVTAVTEWSTDKKSATIIAEEKLKKGTYSVELSGFEAARLDKNKMELTVEDEKIHKLEFVNSSELLPKSNVPVYFRQLNQYGEQTDNSMSRFRVFVSSGHNVEYLSDRQGFKLDVSKADRNMRIPVTIIDEENSLNINKVFTVGDPVLLSKIELGDVKYKDNKTFVQPGEKAYLPFTAFDQYGNRVEDQNTLKTGILPLFVGDYVFEDKGEITLNDIDLDGNPEIELEAYKNLIHDKMTTLKLVAVGSGESVTKELQVLTPKKPATLEVVASPAYLAEGDSDVLVTLKVRDGEGYEFTEDERVALFNSGKLIIHSVGGIQLGSSVAGETGAMELTGNGRGNIRIKSVSSNTGVATIHASIPEIGKSSSAEFELRAKRLPAILEKSEFEPAHEFTVIHGRKATPKFKIRDQYGEEYKLVNDEYQVIYTLEKISGTDGAIIVDPKLGTVFRRSLKDAHDKGIDLKADASKKGSYRLTAKLVRAEKDPNQPDPLKWPIKQEFNSISARAQTYSWQELDKDLKYYLDTDLNMFAIGKYMVDRGLTSKKNQENPKADKEEAAEIFLNRRDLARSFLNGIRALNKNGTEIEIPTATVRSVQILDQSIAVVDKPDFPTAIVGLNPGTTTAYITFDTAAGQKTMNLPITVYTSDLKYAKADMGRKNSTLGVDASKIHDYYIWDDSILKDVKAFDTDETTFKNAANKARNTNNEALTPFMNEFGLKLTVSDIIYKPGTKEEDKDTFYMDESYKLVFLPKSGDYKKVNLKSFKITLSGPDNRPLSLVVEVK
jgi:hypothetical protein